MSEEYDYFTRRLPSRTYVSKRFPDNTVNGNIGRPMRIANKVFDSDKSVALVKEGRQTVVYISPGERQQIKATFYEDDRQISRLSIQKFNTRSGLPAFPAEVHFTFGPEEVATLLNFLRNIQKIPLVDENKFILADNELDKLILSLDQARNLLKNNQSVFSELLQSEITTSDFLILTFRKKQLERFKKLLFDPEYFREEEGHLNKNGEAVWQSFFEQNQWVFGYGLTFFFLSGLDKKKLEQIVAGADIWGHGKRADALMKTRGAIEALCFVEIKKHTSSLLKPSIYRSDSWAPSEDLSGGIVQSQITVANALKSIVEKHYMKDEGGNPTGEQIFAHQPRSFLVIGSLEEFQTPLGPNDEKYRSFELYRRNTLRPEVITFDELYERAKFIVSSAEKL
jgi:hypothetical protein